MISLMPGPPPGQHKHERQYTPSTHSSTQQGQMIFGDLGGLKFADICLTGEEKPRKKTSPRKLVPTWDRTRARCVTSAHATTCSTAVDYQTIKKYKTINSSVCCGTALSHFLRLIYDVCPQNKFLSRPTAGKSFIA